MGSKHENIKVKVIDGMPIEKAIRKFKRLCDSYGIVKQYRAREAYKKPSIQEKEKREAADKRRKKTASKDRQGGSRI